MSRQTLSSLLLLATLVFLVGCQLTALTPSPTPYAVDGKWKGFTEQRVGISFTIKNHKLVDAEIALLGDPSTCTLIGGTTSFYPDPPIAINANSFSANVYGDTLKGVFDSDVTASGSFKIGRWSNNNCMSGTVIAWRAMRPMAPDSSACTQVPLKIEDDSTNEERLFGSGEPETAKAAPDGSCLEIGEQRYIKYAAGTEIMPSSYLVWTPAPRMLSFETLSGWTVWGKSTGPIGALESDQDKFLVEPDSGLPVLEWSEDVGYTALINFYKTAP